MVTRATVAAVFIQIVQDLNQMPLPGAASQSKVCCEGEMDAQCQLSWVLEKPCLLEHLPSMDRGGCFKMTKTNI